MSQCTGSDGWMYRVSDETRSLEVLRNARVPLLWEDTWVFDPCVPSCRHVSYYRLLLSGIRVLGAVCWVLVVVLVGVVVLWVAVGHARIVARVVGVASRRICGRGV